MFSLTPFYQIVTHYSTRRMWYVCHVEKCQLRFQHKHTHNWCFVQNQTWRWERTPTSLRHTRQGVRQRRWWHSSVRAATVHCDRAAVCAWPRAMSSPWCICLYWVDHCVIDVVQHIVHLVEWMHMWSTIAVEGNAECECVNNWSSVGVAWVVIFLQIGGHKGQWRGNNTTRLMIILVCGCHCWQQRWWQLRQWRWWQRRWQWRWWQRQRLQHTHNNRLKAVAEETSATAATATDGNDDNDNNVNGDSSGGVGSSYGNKDNGGHTHTTIS